jgi:hypothetical protein
LTRAREISATPETVISSGTFSSVTAVQLSNALSSTYNFYQLYIVGYASVSAQEMRLKFRENTTDKSSGYYGASFYTNYAGGAAAYNARNNGSDMPVGEFYSSSTNRGTSVITITRPSATQGMVNYTGYVPSSSAAVYGGYNVDSMTNFNGLTFFVPGQTMTGSYVLTGIR